MLNATTKKEIMKYLIIAIMAFFTITTPLLAFNAANLPVKTEKRQKPPKRQNKATQGKIKPLQIASIVFFGASVVVVLLWLAFGLSQIWWIIGLLFLLAGFVLLLLSIIKK